MNNDIDNSREEKQSYGIDDSTRKEISNRVFPKEKLSWSHPDFDALLSEMCKKWGEKKYQNIC